MDKILELLETQGPLTGKMLIEKTKLDGFNLWKICNSSEKIIKTIGRYVRRSASGWICRFSPSIREFYGYTITVQKNMKEIAKRRFTPSEIIEISNKKFKLAQR